MRLAPHWQLAVASGLVAFSLACGSSNASPGGAGGDVGGMGGMGGSCTDDAINACLDLQDCCRAILVNPVFFQSCNAVVLSCDGQRCREVLAGYDTYAPCRPEPEPEEGAGGDGGSPAP